MAKFKGPDYNTAGGSAAPAKKFVGPVYDPPKAPNTGSDYGPMDFLTDTLRNFNDSLTFGLWDKGIDLADKQFFGGSGHAAQDRTAASAPIPKIIGTTLGGIPGGLGFEKGIMSAIPRLSRNEIAPIIVRNAAASGAMSAGEQLGHEGSIDPLQLGIDTAGGGILAGMFAGLSRGVSSGARVRAAGSRLTEADKQAAAITAAKAQSKGITLSVPEAVNAVAPARSGRLQAAKTSAYDSPGGSQEAFRFDMERQPGVERAGKNVVASLPRVSPFDIRVAAGDAIKGVKEGFQGAAKPFYSTAGTKKVPPTWGKAALKVPYVSEAAKAVSKDAGKMKAISNELGRPVKVNDVAFLDAVDKQLKAMFNSAEKDPYKQSILADSGDAVRGLIDKMAPTHSMGRGISEAGANAVNELEAGPLGSISKTGKASTQGGSLLGVADAESTQAALDAVSHLPQPVAQGILANSLDAAVTKNPATWARDVMPNDYSMSVARKAAGSKAPAIEDTLAAARAVDPHVPVPRNREAWSPWNYAFQLLRDYGKTGVAKKLHDPRWIKNLGITGPVQSILTQAVTSGNRVASEGRKHPIDITVPYQ